MKFHSMNQRDSKKAILPVPIGYPRRLESLTLNDSNSYQL